MDVTGTVRSPSSGYQVVGLTVNGRRIAPQYGRDRFRARAVLQLGDNAIAAEARFFGIGGQRLGVVRSRVAHVTRTAGEDSDGLDLATAFLAASSRARRLCDPRRGCISDAYCFAVGPRHPYDPVTTRSPRRRTLTTTRHRLAGASSVERPTGQSTRRCPTAKQ